MDYNLEDCKNHPDDFKVYHHAEPKKEDGSSFTVVQVLPEIVDLPWCHVTMLYVLSLDPVAVRVSTGMVTADAVRGRITVYINGENIITGVEMERNVSVPAGMSGHDLTVELDKLIKENG